jgi:AhpD family alkylhydroperoxidase
MSNTRIAYETFQQTAPGAQAALLAMGKSTEESGLDKTIVELAKLRVSQINNCAFCLQIHLNVSRKLGVPQEKLDLVATWHEAGIFSDKECAALAWAETLTRLADRGVPDDAYDAVRQHFSEAELVCSSAWRSAPSMPGTGWAPPSVSRRRFRRRWRRAKPPRSHAPLPR